MAQPDMEPITPTPTTFGGRFRKLCQDVVRYRRIIFLTAVVNFGSLLFGYDSGLQGAILVLDSFQRDFGIHGSPEAIAQLNSNIVSVLFGGAFFGALLSSPSSYYFGRRKTLLYGSVFFLSGGAIQTACFGSVHQLYVGRFLAGVGVGTVSQVSPVYVSECASKSQRSRAVSAFQLNLVTGGMLAYWTGYGVSIHIDSSRSSQWRIPIAIQLIPGVISAIGLLLIPESPRFLARVQAEEELKQQKALGPRTHDDALPDHHTESTKGAVTALTASDPHDRTAAEIATATQVSNRELSDERALGKLTDTSAPTSPEAKRAPPFFYFYRNDRMESPSPALETLAYLRHLPLTSPVLQAELAEIFAQIYEAQEEAEQGKSTWKELLLKPSNRHRLGVAAFVATYKIWVAQTALLYYAPTIFKSIGFSSDSTSLLASGVFTLLKFVSTIAAMILTVNQYGRVTGMTLGGLVQGTMFFAIAAILATHHVQTDGNSIPSAASKGMMALIYIYVVVYSFGLGPLPWVYASEIFPLNLREAGQLVFSLLTWGNNFAIAKATPLGIVNLGWKIWILFGSFNIGGAIICWLICPETKGRSIEAIDIIFGAVTEEQRARHVEVAMRRANLTPGVAATGNGNC